MTFPRLAAFVVAALMVANGPSRSLAGDPLQAGFAEADITPPAGFRKGGGYSEVISTGVHDPLRAKALVIFPCGYGTLDELFEALTLVQTKKIPPLPIVLFGRDFWNQVLNFQFLVDEGVIDPADAELVKFVESAEESWAYIQDFYRRK